MTSLEAQRIRSNLIRDSIDDIPLTEKRRQWETFADQVAIPAGVTTTTTHYRRVPCMLHHPAHCTDESRVVVYVHGGGLVDGSLLTSREWCSRLAIALAHPVISVGYRLAPEHPYPAAIDDVKTVCQVIASESRFTEILGIGADSTGSVPALATLVALRDAGEKLPSSVFFLSPSLDLSLSGPSMTTNSTVDPLINVSVLESCAELYAKGHNCASPAISPLFHELHDLPPVLIHVDEHEILLDDAKRFKYKVEATGGNVDLVISSGLWHCWPCWGDFPEARIATEQISDHVVRSARR